MKFHKEQMFFIEAENRKKKMPMQGIF